MNLARPDATRHAESDSPMGQITEDFIEGKPRSPRIARITILCLGAWMILTTSAVLVLAELSGKPVFRAVIRMGSGLVFCWNVLGGLVMYLDRDRIRRFVLSMPGRWPVKFVAFCTLLALAEEAITTTLTNLAPVFGVPMGKAYITASANYLDVVCYHSVIIFVPWFVGWAWMLSRWDFHPTTVFLIFGLTGTIAETNFLTRNPAEIGMWVFVYGLMIYLPAYSLPDKRGARPPRWWHYPLAVFLPFPFMVLLLPIELTRSLLHLHPDPSSIHFPPIQMDP
jgi:hypothetical protein